MALPPPGWYDDPDGTASVRWWDGRQWTAASHSSEAGPVLALDSESGRQPSSPTYLAPKNGFATASLIVGLASLVVFPLGYAGAVGAVFGFVGLETAAKHRKSGAKPVGRARAWWGLILSLAAIIAAATFYSLQADTTELRNINTNESRGSDSSQGSSAPQREQPAPTRVKTPAEILDESMEEGGFSVVDSGNNYFRWFNDEEKANSSCGYLACTFGVIYSKNGCSSFYVKADLMLANTPIGWTNATTASARPNETITFELNDVQGTADSFRISEIRCMG